MPHDIRFTMHQGTRRPLDQIQWPKWFLWRVVIHSRVGMNPVSWDVYFCATYDEAWDYINEVKPKRNRVYTYYVKCSHRKQRYYKYEDRYLDEWFPDDKNNYEFAPKQDQELNQFNFDDLGRWVGLTPVDEMKETKDL